MPAPGQPRSALRNGVIVLLLAALAAAWWWTHRRGDAPATSRVTQPQQAPPASQVAAPRAAPIAPGTLAVAVSDDAGPIAGATVRLAPDDGEVVVVTTGRDGVARAEHLDPGTWRITASAGDHAPGAAPPHRLAAGADDRVGIKLAAGGRPLSGTVTDATGGPIAGARIDAARLTARGAPGDAVATAITGADGKYRMTVAEGALLVAAASPDYAPQARPVDVGAAGAVADFALVPGGVIEGIVRDERSREPVAGARVLARRGPAMLLAETGARGAVSGADGRFRLGGLRPGGWELDASEGARSTRRQTVVGLGVADEVAGIELLIGAAPVVRGRVVDETGTAAPGVLVRALGRGDAGETHADAAGAFVLDGLRPGNYGLDARGDAYLPAGFAHVALADQDVDGVVVKVSRGVALRGHVEPRQVCDVQLEVEERLVHAAIPPTIATGADGAFTLSPVAPGSARLSARCASGDEGAAQVAVSAGMADAVVPVTPGATIAGRVVDGDGKPAAAVTVVASEVSHGERTTISNGVVTSGVQGLTDASGSYKLVGLAPGSYRVGALERGRPVRLRKAAPAVELAAHEHKTGVDLAINRPNGVISGTVTDRDGKPIADAWVSVQPDLVSMLAGDSDGAGPPGRPAMRTMMVDSADGAAGDTSIPPALTDAQGRYAIRGLAPATYTVVGESLRGQLRARATDVRPDATVDLKLVAITSLSGTVAGVNGPPALFSVELEGPTRTQRSFTDGKFGFDRVDPGSYTVRVTSADGNGQARVDVPADGPATVAITLAANAILVGKLLDPAGAPLAGIPVALVPDTGDGRLQIRLEGPPPTTGADGSFRLEHSAGSVALIVLRPTQPFSKRGIVLAAGRTVDLGAITVDGGGGPGAPPGGPPGPPGGSSAPPAGSGAPRPPAPPRPPGV